VSSTKFQPELASLLELMFEDALAAPDRARLNQMLLADEAARRFYLTYVGLGSSLSWRSNGSLRTSFNEQQLASMVGQAPSVSLTTAVAVPRVLRFSRWTAQSLAASIGLVAILFYGAFLIISWNLQPGANQPVPELADGTFETTPATGQIVRLMAAHNCRWKGLEKRPIENEALPQGPFELVSGIAQLAFAGGAQVTIAGPARIEPRSASHLMMRSGKLLAHVPQRAIGFTVETPTATIVDLGTEFDVITSESGETNVNVRKGRVSVQPVANAAGLRATRFVMRAGEAKRIETDGSVSVSSDTASGSWNLLANGLKKKDVERQAFSEGLVAYWAFDEQSQNPIWDRRGSSHGAADPSRRAAGLIGQGALKSAGASGQMAQFYGREETDTFSQAISIEAMFVSSWSGEPGDYDYIVRRQQGGAIVVSFVFKNDEEDDVDGPVLALDVQTDHGRQSLSMPLDGQDGRPTLAALTDGQAHYVAATFDGVSDEMAIYVDGVKQMNRSLGQSMSLASGKDLPTPATEAARKSDDPFCGVLDEIAIYRAALSAEEVARHWQNVSHGHSYFAP
jgi:hypothetical protein